MGRVKNGSRSPDIPGMWTISETNVLKQRKRPTLPDLEKYFEEISMDTSKYCFGVEDTFRALEMGAVERLIVWENLEITRYQLKNHQTDVESVLFLKPEEEKDKTFFTDKNTGVEMELIEQTPLIDWLVNNYKSFGASLDIITDKTAEGAQFVRGFGGLGGLLRYRVEFQSFETNLEDELDDLDLDDY